MLLGCMLMGRWDNIEMLLWMQTSVALRLVKGTSSQNRLQVRQKWWIAGWCCLTDQWFVVTGARLKEDAMAWNYASTSLLVSLLSCVLSWDRTTLVVGVSFPEKGLEDALDPHVTETETPKEFLFVDTKRFAADSFLLRLSQVEKGVQRHRKIQGPRA